MTDGNLCLVLHAHLPFVRHPEQANALEERWLYEAITETYIPLIGAMEQWEQDGLNWGLTLSLSPTLVAMLQDTYVQMKYADHLQKLIDLASEEYKRTELDPLMHRVTSHYQSRFQEVLTTWQKYGGDLTCAFAAIASAGHLELITSAATHAFLPLILTEAAVRAQIELAVQSHIHTFGKPPRGLWLPECAFRPGLDEILASFGIEYFFVDAHGLADGGRAPVFGEYAPVRTRAGVYAFGRDPKSTEPIWNATHGYPGDYNYREFYRDVGYDAPYEEIKPYLPEGIRIDTGLKYYQITGRNCAKEPYDPEQAIATARMHAEDYVGNCSRHAAGLKLHLGKTPVLTAAFDAELFGHWWYEGPQFLDALVRTINRHEAGMRLSTPPECMSRSSESQRSNIEFSSWGRNGYAEVWLNGANDWVYPALHKAECDMVQLADAYDSPTALERRTLNQAARELMLAQSSDWAFIMDNQTAVDYAVKRTKTHINRFFFLHHMLTTNCIGEDWLQRIENCDNLFPHMDYRVYATVDTAKNWLPAAVFGGRTVLMLSWEYPPVLVGGLARHVYHLAQSLSANGCEVHVVTQQVDGCPAFERDGPVYVHRAPIPKPPANSFLDWVFQLNLGLIEKATQLRSEGFHPALIHAHDWLVQTAAVHLKTVFCLPLVSTIHATEHGRNGGVHTPLQRRIHDCEWTLTHESARVIVCSDFMKSEVHRVFRLPEDRMTVVPNGVNWETAKVNHHPCEPEPSMSELVSEAKTVLFVGRMVREKGVEVLLDAVPKVLHAVPNTQFVLLGTGPMLDHWRARASALGLDQSVRFFGFVEDLVRDAWLHRADVCVFPSLYEPFGIVALEAMAAGTPVIVSDTGGLREVVTHGETGLTCFCGHADSLADQVIRVLTDPALSERLRVSALSMVEQRYQWNAIAARTAETYDLVLLPTLPILEGNAG